ncbi:neprilysin-like [Amblyomma americanum]
MWSVVGARKSPAPFSSTQQLLAPVSSGDLPPPTDRSSLRSAPLYVGFVVATASLTSVALFVAPAMLFARAGHCRKPGGCYSLERDLMESIDSSVHPCDDLYRHVCHGWNKRENETSPIKKYSARFKDMFLWNLLKRTIPRKPRTALDKASSMLLHCIKEGTEPASKGGEPLRKFLLDVGLSWPQKSAANRQQLLDLLVKLSLDLGMPTLWKFSIGRHPSKPTENTLYMALDTRYTGWSSDLKRLEARDALHRHLRRAAEVVGGIGKSYSGMIEDVLTTHEQFKKVLQVGISCHLWEF